ncbi:MAG: cell division protein ZapA [Gammaproteobacteria bacterium]|nr:cell division protein ZapA [Gammaproteobacteria bacterium]
MGKEYTVECPPEEHEALVASAEYVNERMSTIRKRGKALGAERIAVMVALNIARELLAIRGVEGIAQGPAGELLERVRQLKLDIDSTLAAD